jgi:NADH-quinone oxidoreductase subunit J
MYVMMRAELLAAVQVLVYAGAVMVLFLFASLIINIPRALQLRQWNRQSVLAVLMAGVTGLCMIVATTRAFGSFRAPEMTPLGTPRAIGQLVFSDYILPFELASLVLLAAMVGAIYLARGAADEEDSGVPTATAGLAAVGDDANESI